MEKIHIFLFIYRIKQKMITKTKLTITIDKEILKKFDEKCEKGSINKSKLISKYIKDWSEKKDYKNE